MKELVALSDGYRESTESWADLLRDCKRRGMSAPVLAAGDGAGVLGRVTRGLAQAGPRRRRSPRDPPPTDVELIDLMARELALHKRPEIVRYVEALPRNEWARS